MDWIHKIKPRGGIHPLVKNDYIGRIIFCLLGFLVGLPFFYQLKLELHYYIIFIAILLLWPHLAFLLACLSKNQRKFELYFNLNMDPFVCGIWLPLVQMNPIGVILFFVATGSVGIVTGGVKILLTRIISLLIAILTGFVLFGFHYNPESSMLNIITIGLGFVILVFTQDFISYNTNNKLSQTKKELKIQKSMLETLSSKLSKYLSPQIYESIFSGKKDVKIETTRKKLTIFFSDIKGFTETTDRMEAEDLSVLLNSYLDSMAGIAMKHGGTIDKFIGDAIMIFFGDPETHGEREDALRCVTMAIEMRDRMDAMREEWRARGVTRPLHIRMGINTGFCTVGNFGSEERLDYTIIGGQVNLASRLESNAGPDQILISQESWLLVKDRISCREMGEIQVKGIAAPVLTYQVIDFYENAPSSREILKEEEKGISLRVDLNQTEADHAAEVLKRMLSEIEGR